jgi:hypothetical protein
MHPSPPEFLQSPSRDQRIRILHRCNNGPHAAGEEQINAGWGLSKVRAGLKVHIKGRVTKVAIYSTQTIDLGVRISKLSMESTCENSAVLDEDCTYHRVRADTPFPTKGQTNGLAHESFMTHVFNVKLNVLPFPVLL